ncbi:DUF418 domain-containing protein [Pseudomarimonas salicorniae]|uniref:DUF418 domain-containing protein n=1 Tax=Pseudomarimonas salicorniae TaxID=2933270 RepID=A0ABT0GFW0_9GAMM|nr:DUF418 domain-containing protein [Lysobacter sp. CAU 1642]MCK7593420.1 DUF418 domain-containing protein [Lysobacter sp. CAU 1642]
MEPLVPTRSADRALQLDVLRGFALIGILLMNIEGFVGPLNISLLGLNPELSGADRWVDALIYVLVQGKFYTLFSLLFGAGFALILQRAEARGSGGGWLYLRRLLVLLGIGLVHALWIWAGDILVSYALTGMLLLLFFRRTPASRAPKWGIALYLVPSALFLLLSCFAWLASFDPASAEAFAQGSAEARADFAEVVAAQRAAYGPEGSFAAATAQRISDTGDFLGYFMFFGPQVLGMFLIGVGLIRSGALLEPADHLPLFRNLRLYGFLLGLPAAILSFWQVPTMDWGRMDFEATGAAALMAVASLLLCLAYLSSIVLALQQPVWRERLAVLAPAGQMALTNYLMQSLICVGLFYGYGLGYFEQLPRAWQPLFVLALFAAQVALSHWWLARFRFGPAEWLWRTLTYLRWQPMLRR